MSQRMPACKNNQSLVLSAKTDDNTEHLHRVIIVPQNLARLGFHFCASAFTTETRDALFLSRNSENFSSMFGKVRGSTQISLNEKPFPS